MTTDQETQEIVTPDWPKNWFGFYTIIREEVLPRVPKGLDWYLEPGGDGQWTTQPRDKSGRPISGVDILVGWDSEEHPVTADTVIPLVLRFCPRDYIKGLARALARLEVWCERVSEAKRLGAEPWLESAD